MKKFAFIYNLTLILVLTGHGQQEQKNIILLIGDGMGTTQVSAAMTVAKGNLNLARAQSICFSQTGSLTNYVTESAAGATAISTGSKTKIGAIATDINGKPLKTILEYAKEENYSVGLIATSSITHATPASFVAHQISRNENEVIALDIYNADLDLFIGGGMKYFRRRADKLNLIDSLIAKDYLIIKDLKSSTITTDKKIAGLLANDALPRYTRGRGDMLSEATSIALDKLSQNQKGFFLMVEGSQIDWGGHANNIDYVTSELIDFDQTVGIAFDFADKNPGTLVIVTADHETGGLTLVDGDLERGSVVASFSTKGHTGVMVPVFVYGESNEVFHGIIDNTDLFYLMMEYLEIKHN